MGELINLKSVINSKAVSSIPDQDLFMMEYLASLAEKYKPEIFRSKSHDEIIVEMWKFSESQQATIEG